MTRVAALFVRKDTVYRKLGADCYDAERDARTFDLACPVVAHPPCRAWSKLRAFAKPRDDEKDLARWAMHVVRHCGGVLEHPLQSGLWRDSGCNWTLGVRDAWGGVLVSVFQSWFGHRADKATGLYIVGPVPDLAKYPPVLPSAVVERMCTAERERTPPAFAKLLVDIARAAA